MNAKDLFIQYSSVKIAPLLEKSLVKPDKTEGLAFNKIIKALIKKFDLKESLIYKTDSEIMVSHPDFDYNLRITISLLNSEERDKNFIYFFLAKLSKKSKLPFALTNFEEVLNLEEGRQYLGITYDDVDRFSENNLNDTEKLMK